VAEALCFGWIDGIRKRLDADTYTIRFTRRRPGSIWSAINVAKVEELEAQRLMHPAGRAAFSARNEERSGIYSHEQREQAKLAPAYAKLLRGNAKAWTYFQAQAPWYRRAATHWVMSAKKEETRERRLRALIADSAAGRTVGPLTRPVG
jgi:uncharacterized protein YdeI (YjbR/CyaY-like superfamily)